MMAFRRYNLGITDGVNAYFANNNVNYKVLDWLSSPFLFLKTASSLDVVTHEAVNTKIVEGTFYGFSLDSYSKNNLGFQYGISAIVAQNKSIEDWLVAMSRKMSCSRCHYLFDIFIVAFSCIFLYFIAHVAHGS
jgi:hypothetical protein